MPSSHHHTSHARQLRGGQGSKRKRTAQTLGALYLLVLAACATPLRSGQVEVRLSDTAPEDERIAVHWEQAGQPPAPGTPAVLIFHGGPGAPQREWWKQPFWHGLGAHATLLYFHHRGSGGSSPLTGRAAPAERAEAYTLARIAEDAEAIRREVLGPEAQVVAFGQSAGAALALLYAARHPEAVAKVILVSPAADHRWVSAQRDHLAGFLDTLVAGDEAATAGLARARAGLDCPGWGPDTLSFHVLGRWGVTRAGQLRVREALAAAGRGEPAPLCALASPQPRAKATPGFAALYRTIACRELGWAEVAPANCEGVPEPGARLDLRPGLASVRGPVLLLAPAHDPIVPTPYQRELWQLGAWPGALVELPEVGHDPLAEAPDESLNAVLGFL